MTPLGLTLESLFFRFLQSVAGRPLRAHAAQEQHQADHAQRGTWPQHKRKRLGVGSECARGYKRPVADAGWVQGPML